MNEKDIKGIANSHGWAFSRYLGKQHGKGIRFSRVIDEDVQHLDVWPTSMTVSTILTHPKKGRGQMFRKRVGRKELSALFKNPRQHTTGGYRDKTSTAYGKKTKLR